MELDASWLPRQRGGYRPGLPFASGDGCTAEERAENLVLIGETGVGKSLLLRSIDLLRGSRGKTDWIRHGADEARVAGSFRLDDPALARSIEERVLTAGKSGSEIADSVLAGLEASPL